MPGPSPGGSPEREVGTGGRQRGPGRGRRVRFRLPPTAIALPSVREEEQVFYRRLEALAAPGPGGFGPLFAADGWSDLTEDRLLRKRLVRDGQDGLRPRPGQEVSVKVLGALEDGGLVERDPRLTFVPGYGDVVQALELGVLTMQPGEVAFFLAAFPYGYGRPGSPSRAAGGRGAAGTARQVLQQLRGRGDETAAGGGGAGGLRGGAEHQPGQRPGAAPARAAAGAAGPGRGGRACPEESPGAGPRQRGLSGRGARLGAAPGPPGVPPQPRPPQPPRRPQVVHAELSRLVKRRSAPAAPQEPPHGPMPPPSSGDSAPPTAEGAA
ncbi:collagen alpha-1(I) chain-like isoform X3 [Pezoporus wallicus]|uniref:collagen alpha-1(I) chain-like isoform X3 n=1 Tax=Pezoporus wallicus TaxID=35540 RepID=UPI00254C0B1C|nr:collagen alpha-1(I) chain-like isoform X3 [Pezoporus wallicus]